MDLEPQTVEHLDKRCEECGATLTAAEQQAVLESGGPVLCTIHMQEVVPVADEEDALE